MASYKIIPIDSLLHFMGLLVTKSLFCFWLTLPTIIRFLSAVVSDLQIHWSLCSSMISMKKNFQGVFPEKQWFAQVYCECQKCLWNTIFKAVVKSRSYAPERHARKHTDPKASDL